MTPPAAGRHDRGGVRTYATLVALAVGVRLALYAGCWVLLREPLQTLLRASDGLSFLRVARLIYGAAPTVADVSSYDSRVFLTWPLTFGWTRLVGHDIGGLFALTVAAAAAAPCLWYALTGSRRLALLICVAPPAWLLSTTFPMSEGVCLALALASLLALLRGREGLAGLLAGLMLAGRPFGIALIAGQIWVLLRRGEGARRALLFSAAVAVAPIATSLLELRLFGDAFHQVAVYAMPLADLNVAPGTAAALGMPSGHWGWPFAALLMTPIQVRVPIWKLLYVYANLAVMLAACGGAVRKLRRDPTDLDLCHSVWLLGNTAFAVCGGPYWGFFSFDRWCIWALPAVLWPYREWLERRLGLTLAIGAASILAVVWALSRYI